MTVNAVMGDRPWAKSDVTSWAALGLNPLRVTSAWGRSRPIAAEMRSRKGTKKRMNAAENWSELSTKPSALSRLQTLPGQVASKRLRHLATTSLAEVSARTTRAMLG